MRGPVVGILLVCMGSIHCMSYQEMQKRDIDCFERGMQQWESDDCESAKLYFDHIVKEEASAYALECLGKRYEELDDINNALDCYQIAADKGSVTALNDLGILYEGQGNRKKAIELFRQAAALGDLMGIYNVGLAHFKKGNFDKALHRFCQAAKKNCPEALCMIAICCEKNGKNPIEYLKEVRHPQMENALEIFARACEDDQMAEEYRRLIREIKEEYE